MNNYWKRAGNAKWGMQQLARDIYNRAHPKRQMEQPNIPYREPINQPVTENVSPSTPQAPPIQQPAPQQPSTSNVNNYYNYPSQTQPQTQQVYRQRFGFFQTVSLVTLMAFIAGITFLLITNPAAITQIFERIVQFFHGVI